MCGPGSLHTGGLGDNKPTDEMELRRVIENHKVSLKRRFENIPDDIINLRAERNRIYQVPFITGESDGVNKEHEFWQIEMACRKHDTEDTPINCNDIFKPFSGQEKNIRTVMTKGIAGIGKTISVQKFILDWTDGVANQNVDFIFPLCFRELNLVKDDQYCLHRLLLDFYPELKELNDGEEYKNCQVVFIFDGLDETQLPLNFQHSTIVSDVKQTSTVDVLVMNLFQKNLLPSAFIWITSRPAAANRIPAQYIDQVTEVRGFSDQQKEEYFRKIISDESQANRIIPHIKASRSLYTMCHIPVFCWISATVLQQMLEQVNCQEIPKTLTEMFIHFLAIQTGRKSQRHNSGTQTNTKHLLESQKDVTLKLAKMAFKHLENGNVLFYEKDLRECGIDVSEASVYVMCTEIFKEESVFCQRRVYCFAHLTIQEFLAALHIFLSYTYDLENIGFFFCLEEAMKYAVTRVLENRDGHLDLFLCFLMGISLESNQRLLKGLLNKIHNTSKSIKKTCQYIKKLNMENVSPERCISLLQCLSEVNDNSMHEEIQQYRESPNCLKQKWSPAHCSALAHMLLISEEVMDEFDPKEYSASEEGFRRLIPAVRCCRKARFNGCNLNSMSCETFKKSLQSPNSLIQLDLSHNALGDCGVQILSVGLTSSQCQLQILRLVDCKLSGESCKMLIGVLQSPNSLTELDLSHNDLGDSGVYHLSLGLAQPYCKLQILRLCGCLISEEGCQILASALTPSHLKELDLSYNHPGESGQKLLSARLEDPDCKLKTVNLEQGAEIRLRPGVRKYACKLTLDPNTAHRLLSLSEGNKKLTVLSDEQPYPDHPERFDWWLQVLCRDGLSGRCYWEAEWSGEGAHIAVASKSIKRKGESGDSLLGRNDMSWSLYCTPDGFFAWHSNKRTDIPAPSSGSRRIGVYLDWPAGTLSFYSISSDTLTHLHTFHSTFTEPLYPGFGVWPNTLVSLCQIT